MSLAPNLEPLDPAGKGDAVEGALLDPAARGPGVRQDGQQRIDPSSKWTCVGHTRWYKRPSEGPNAHVHDVHTSKQEYQMFEDAELSRGHDI